MDVALVKYRIAAVQTPNSAQLWNNIGMCFFGKGKYVASIACLKKGSYLAPFEWIISYNLGVVHLTSEQYASAFQYFSTAINLQPSYSKAYMYLAITLSHLEDFENSCSAYEKAIELSPEDYLIFLNYSITLFLNDEIEKSKEQYGRFEVLFNLQTDKNDVDPEIVKQSDFLRRFLNVE
jgi:Bardet-Biedl syndrome 4 protein